MSVISQDKYVTLEYRLRLAEANETHVSPPPQREAVRGHPDEEKVIRAFLHSSPLAIFVVDPGGSIQYWSGAAERLFGWSRAEVSGQAPPFPIPSGDSNAALPCRVSRKDGSPLELELHVAPLQDGSLGEADRLVVASVPVAAAGAKAPAVS